MVTTWVKNGSISNSIEGNQFVFPLYLYVVPAVWKSLFQFMLNETFTLSFTSTVVLPPGGNLVQSHIVVPILFTSFLLSKAEQAFCTFKKVCGGVGWGGIMK